MTDLPAGWAWATLDELTESERPICYGILMPKENIPDGVPYVKVRDFPKGVIDVVSLQRTSTAIAEKFKRSSLRHGDILVSIRGTFGRVALVPPDLEGGNVTQDTARVSPLPWVMPTFVAHFLRSEQAQRYFKQVARGVAVKGVNIGDLRLLRVPVPPPSEQERIVAAIEEHLSRLDAAESALHRSARRLAALATSVASATFAIEAPRAPIGAIARVGGGATPSRSTQRYWTDGTVPWVTSGALNDPVIAEPSALITEAALKETAVKLWPRGTVLVAMYGEGRTRGRAAELSFESTCNQACAAIQVDPQVMRPRFLRWFMNSQYEQSRALASGGVQPNLSLGLVKAIEVPTPSLEVQDQIIAELEERAEQNARLATAVQRDIRRADQLRRSVLAAAFKGRLATQDSNDEPASVLLERIRVERANETKARAGRRRAVAS